MNRHPNSASLLLAAVVGLGTPAYAGPATQACLGARPDQTLKCPAGTKRVVSSTSPKVVACLKKGGPRGVIPIRHGPAIWYYPDGKTVKRAGTYHNHTKVGRWYRFDKQGRLQEIDDMRDDWSTYGYRIRCSASGRLVGLTYYNKNGREEGRSFHYSGKGVFKYAKDYRDGAFSGKRDPRAKPPGDALCHPAKCVFVAQPNRPHGVGADPTGGRARDKAVKLTRPPKRSRIGKTY